MEILTFYKYFNHYTNCLNRFLRDIRAKLWSCLVHLFDRWQLSQFHLFWERKSIRLTDDKIEMKYHWPVGNLLSTWKYKRQKWLWIIQNVNDNAFVYFKVMKSFKRMTMFLYFIINSCFISKNCLYPLSNRELAIFILFSDT